MILHLIFRLSIWFLLTADLSPANIMIGIAIALILPRPKLTVTDLKEWLQVGKKIFIAFPQAYLEALEIMIFPHQKEIITQEKVSDQRPAILIFFDIFLITFTPKTIVLKYQKEGWYDVHKIVLSTGQKNREEVAK
jgi:multicomponent Na+:H+ antiporter subunit E